MASKRPTTRMSSSADTPRAVDDLAATALARVAPCRVHTETATANPKISRRLLDSVMQRSGESQRAVVDGMLRAGVSPEALVDIYIPDVARRMGSEWETDEASFAHVTVGSSRLQGLLREMDEIWDTRPSGSGRDVRPLICVLTVPGAQHTLGATVLTTQLRRLGCSVKLQTSPTEADVPSLCANCDAIFISAAKSDKADAVARLVSDLRGGTGATYPPIVLGGSLLDGAEGLKSLTGVDHVARDCVAALEVCGIDPMWTGETGP